ncbi:alanine racemase, partial [Klebsiella pneumoniae]|nr:alanine racemase [Klebsiella pneumoniae]
EEGTRLRALGCKKPLLLLEGVFALTDLFECAKHEMSFAIHSSHQVQWLKQFAEIVPDAQFDVFLKMNSGMNRLGFEPQQYAEIWQELHQLNNVRSITH